MEAGNYAMTPSEVALAKTALDFAEVAHTAKSIDAGHAHDYGLRDMEQQFVEHVKQLRMSFELTNPLV
jgi:hypothetical protein